MALLLCCHVPVSAEEITEARVPVTLTVINTERPISVTVPAALPVSVVDGKVLTANNAKITNNTGSGTVRVTGIVVEDGALTVSDFHNFGGRDNTIALSINGCGTTGVGSLQLNELSFPDYPRQEPAYPLRGKGCRLPNHGEHHCCYRGFHHRRCGLRREQNEGVQTVYFSAAGDLPVRLSGCDGFCIGELFP